MTHDVKGELPMIEDDDEGVVEKMVKQKEQLAKQLIGDNISVIAKSLHTFWSTHAYEIGSMGANVKKEEAKLPNYRNVSKVSREARRSEGKTESYGKRTALDLLTVLSSLSDFLEKGNTLNSAFLDMIVGVLSTKNV